MDSQRQGGQGGQGMYMEIRWTIFYIKTKKFINHLLIILQFSFPAHLSACECYPSLKFTANRPHQITPHYLWLSFYFPSDYLLSCFISLSPFLSLFIFISLVMMRFDFCLPSRYPSSSPSNYQSYLTFRCNYFLYQICSRSLCLLAIWFSCMHFLLTNLFPTVSFLSPISTFPILLFLFPTTFSVAVSNRFSLSRFFVHWLFSPIYINSHNYSFSYSLKSSTVNLLFSSMSCKSYFTFSKVAYSFRTYLM